MQRLILALLLALLAGCGSNSDEGGNGSGKVGGPVRPAEGDLSDLDGLPLEDFIRAIVPRLAKEPGLQSAANLAASLDQKWKIHCEQICRIERK